MILQTILATAIAVSPAPHLDRIDWALLASDASARALDVYSTHKMLAEGNRELFLPKAVAGHVPAMALYSGAVVALNFTAARWLTQHHHPRMAKVLIGIDADQDAFWAIHNLYLKPSKR